MVRWFPEGTREPLERENVNQGTLNLDRQAIQKQFPKVKESDLATANSREEVAAAITSHGYSRAEVDRWLEENEEDTS